MTNDEAQGMYHAAMAEHLAKPTTFRVFDPMRGGTADTAVELAAKNAREAAEEFVYKSAAYAASDNGDELEIHVIDGAGKRSRFTVEIEILFECTAYEYPDEDND